MNSTLRRLAPLSALAIVASAGLANLATAAADDSRSVLDAVREAGVVRCGVRPDLPGFNNVDASGEHVGFDADFCRVIAAGILGDATAVEFVDVPTENRFTALAAGEYDVLVRNTTWTASRDGNEGAEFLHTTFFDGQGMMVPADLDVSSLDDMDGANICVAAGTTTEGNVANEFDRRGLTVNIRSFPDVPAIQAEWDAGNCDGWTADASQLAGIRSSFADPESGVILAEVFSKEPLGPAVRDGDYRWAQAVNWVVMATIQAEEYGVDSTNVDEMAAGEGAVARFLGAASADGAVLDPGIGLDPAFAYNIVSQVGNYGEIFDAHIVPLGLERGPNALWIDGGLQYVPPFR